LLPLYRHAHHHYRRQRHAIIAAATFRHYYHQFIYRCAKPMAFAITPSRCRRFSPPLSAVFAIAIEAYADSFRAFIAAPPLPLA
jgi:hypothetical protein